MKKKLNLFFLLLILSAGFFLRVNKIATNYYFSGELGKELLYMRQFALIHSLPIIGMATSHPWLSYGPIYYWITIPIFDLFNGNPYILFWVAAVVSILGLILNYVVVKKIVNDRIALFSTMIEAFSPLLIWQTRLSKLHVFFWIIMPVFMLLTYFMWNGKKNWVFWCGLLFGVLFSFHFSQIPILGVVILLFLIKKHVYKFFDWIKFGIGVLIPNITLIWTDRDLALWLPYRIASIADKNPAGTWASLLEYFGKNIFWDQRLWFIGLIVCVLIFVHYVIQNKNKLKDDFLPFYLISSISLMVVANVIHGAPPIHYFLPIFTTLPILMAIYLSRLKYWYLIVIPVVIINFLSFEGDPLFYKNFSGLVKGTDEVSYSMQNNISSYIAWNTKGKPLSIKRIGAFDYFPDDYAQNYMYLTLFHGGNVVDNSSNVYIIIEDSRKGEVNVQK